MRTMVSDARSSRRKAIRPAGRRTRLALVLTALAIALAARPAHADVMSRAQPATPAPPDDWTLHTALGLDLGAGGTITSFNPFPGSSSTLFFTGVRGTYDIAHGFAGMFTLHQWWLPGPNHALLIGFGARYEPFVYSWGRLYFDAAVGPASTGYDWTFGFDLGAGLDFDMPDVPGFSLGPYVRYGDFINPYPNDGNDGTAWNLGVSISYHFGRAAAAPHPEQGPAVKRGTWHISLPDTDRDGVTDDEDQCKDVPAGKHPDPFRPGCPESDEDEDGIPDSDDPCPVTPPGPNPDPKRPGCPIIDTDGDKIPDADDACPTKAGPASPDPLKNGCPEKRSRSAAPPPPPPSATDEAVAPKPVRKRHVVKPSE
ncbi:MAG TPA: thrombospondin type 3 repeat-containing protein [Polyangia bacterium]|nr:thrombospondin type 3 repeat-containing protein [Polyangia bacterium]